MKRSISFALSTSVVMGTLAVPGVAFAAPAAAPTARSVAGHAQQFGHLFVDDLTADSEVIGVEAVVHKQGDDTALATVRDFRLADGAGATGDWITRDEVKLAAAGSYAVDLVVKEADGDETSLKNAGVYDYTAKRYFDGFGVDRANPTLDDMSVTASGRLLEWQPVTHERRPLVGAHVDMYNHTFIGWVEHLTTDAKGRFSDSFSAEAQPVPVYALSGGLRTETVTVTPKPVAARLALDTTVFSGVYNTPKKIAGKVEFQAPDGTWRTTNFIDVDIEDEKGRYYGRSFTSKDGRFNAEIRVPAAGTRLRARASNGGWFTNQPTVPLTFRTTAVTAINQFEIELNGFHELNVGGWIDVDGVTRPHGNIEIQVSKNGKSGWTKLGTVRIREAWGSAFSGTVKASPTGYYRAVYAGTSSGSFTVPRATSKVLYAGRSETRIANYKATPAKVKRNGTITVSGTLLHRTPGWKAYAKQPATIYFRPKKAPWQSYTVAEVKTAANGTFAKKVNVKNRGDGWYFTVHYPDSKHLSNAEVAAYVDTK